MGQPNSSQYGVILQNGEYATYLVLGNKNDGKIVIFPPLNVPQENVLGYFESEEGARLWIVSKKLEMALQELLVEKAAHAATKTRARLLLETLGAFKDVV